MAAEIIKQLPKGRSAHAYPIIGAGLAFEGLCEIVGPRSEVSSQGSRVAKFSVLRDLPAMIASIAPAIGFLRKSRHRYENVIVVGDSVGVILCLMAGVKIDIYVDVFKTGYAHRYSSLDLWAIGRAARKVFCRDDMLASQLRNHGIDAVSHGNIMLDTITYGEIDIPPRNDGNHVIGLLPGSRAGTPAAFALQIDALEILARSTGIVGYAAVADGFDIDALALQSRLSLAQRASDDAHRIGRLEGRGLVIELFSGATGNVIAASDLVLSQAGTATQQALGLGKPVITYFPIQHRKKRMEDEQALMGEARLLLPPDPDLIAQGAARLLDDPVERERLGAIGRQRLGKQGTLAAIIAEFGKDTKDAAVW